VYRILVMTMTIYLAQNPSVIPSVVWNCILNSLLDLRHSLRRIEERPSFALIHEIVVFFTLVCIFVGYK